jgi:hypothetical protein
VPSLNPAATKPRHDGRTGLATGISHRAGPNSLLLD